MDFSENEKKEKAKDTFSNAFKKAAQGAKSFVEQTKKNIHDQQAKKYTAVTKENFCSSDFQLPIIIEICDDFAKRDFIVEENAIGWIEKHKDVPVLHMYSKFVSECGLVFIPVPQRDSVYCADNFDPKKYINSNHIFGKATQEKLAELNNIAYCLGAKSCSIEIIESDTDVVSRSAQLKVQSSEVCGVGDGKTAKKSQSGKNVSYFEGHDDPQMPNLKWFAHDDNIKGLIEMRRNRAIKSNVLELKGSSSATMSQTVACAIDNIAKGGLSMEKQVIKEYSNTLLFEVEF